jgi:predicted transcriptional regulator
MVSVAGAISAISNEKALSLFKAIALSQKNDTDILITKLRLNRNQFYSIVKKLIDADLVKRINGKYRLTSFGKVIFSAQQKVEAEIETAIKYYLKLKAIDSIMISVDKTDISAEECQMIIDKLIDNYEIKAILVSNK